MRFKLSSTKIKLPKLQINRSRPLRPLTYEAEPKLLTQEVMYVCSKQQVKGVSKRLEKGRCTKVTNSSKMRPRAIRGSEAVG